MRKIPATKMTITLNECASCDAIVQSLLRRAEAIDYLVSLLKEGEKSRVELDDLFARKFPPCTHVTASTLLIWFEAYGWVKSEVREEETILVNFTKYDDNMTMRPNADGTLTVNNSFWKHPIVVIDPVISTKYYGTEVTGKRQIRVKRKYYKWVA